MLGSADDDKCNIITAANDNELCFDADTTENTSSNCGQKLFFSNCCMVRSKLKPFELSFGANSDSSTYTMISQMASQTVVWVYCELHYWQSNRPYIGSLSGRPMAQPRYVVATRQGVTIQSTEVKGGDFDACGILPKMDDLGITRCMFLSRFQIWWSHCCTIPN